MPDHRNHPARLYGIEVPDYAREGVGLVALDLRSAITPRVQEGLDRWRMQLRLANHHERDSIEEFLSAQHGPNWHQLKNLIVT